MSASAARKPTRITPAKVRSIIEGAELAGRQVDSIEIDGMIVRLAHDDNEDKGSPRGLGKKKWSKS